MINLGIHSFAKILHHTHYDRAILSVAFDGAVTIAVVVIVVPIL